MRSIRLTAVGAAVTVLMVPGVAAAFDNVTFNGTARFCAEPPDDPKPQASDCPVEKPNGLYHRGTPGTSSDGSRSDATDTSKWMDRHGDWSIQSSTCMKTNALAVEPLPIACQIEASGVLGPVAVASGPPVGAACDAARGSEGTGIYTADNGTAADLFNIEWVLTPGGSATITGDYEMTSAPKGGKPFTGPFSGTLQIRDGSFCHKVPMATDTTGEQGQTQVPVSGSISFEFE